MTYLPSAAPPAPPRLLCQPDRGPARLGGQGAAADPGCVSTRSRHEPFETVRHSSGRCSTGWSSRSSIRTVYGDRGSWYRREATIRRPSRGWCSRSARARLVEQAGVEMPVQAGDHVIFPASAGAWVEVDEERLLVCRVGELLGVLEPLAERRDLGTPPPRGRGRRRSRRRSSDGRVSITPVIVRRAGHGGPAQFCDGSAGMRAISEYWPPLRARTSLHSVPGPPGKARPAAAARRSTSPPPSRTRAGPPPSPNNPRKPAPGGPSPQARRDRRPPTRGRRRRPRSRQRPRDW